MFTYMSLSLETLTVSQSQVVLSIVIPCLNEQDSIGSCIQKAKTAITELSLPSEIIIVDNGSTDSSAKIASTLGTRVVQVTERGYGHALMGGIAAAKGQYIVMGDADDSYDFSEIRQFVHKLKEGYDLVQGCRFPRGGGIIKPHAMPFLHRYVGNPLLSFIARVWFKTQLQDIYCGMRAFTKPFYLSLNQSCAGMEFAAEMIVKASMKNAKISEVPITLYKDARKSHRSHLKTFRDGWKTLRFFLLFCPRWLFLLPGLMFLFLGAFGYGIAMPGLTFFNKMTFDAHTLVFASLSILTGYQMLLFCVYTKTYASEAGFLTPDPLFNKWSSKMSLEKGIATAGLAFLAGISLLIHAIYQWVAVDFGHLDYGHTMRWVIPGATLVAFAIQTIFSSFFLSILRIHKK